MENQNISKPILYALITTEREVKEVVVVNGDLTMDSSWECWIFTTTEQKPPGISAIILTLCIYLAPESHIYYLEKFTV